MDEAGVWSSVHTNAFMKVMLTHEQWTEHDSAAVRLVSREWRKTHDDNVRRLRPNRWTEDIRMTCASRFSNVCELVFDKPDADLVEPPVRPILKPQSSSTLSAGSSLRTLHGCTSMGCSARWLQSGNWHERLGSHPLPCHWRRAVFN